MLGHLSGVRLQCVVVMRRDHALAFCGERDEERRAVRPTRNCDQDTIRRRDQLRSPEPDQQWMGSAGRVGGGHGGAGWTRTTDNAIMSRALYRLSYGTPAPGVKPT